MFLPQFPPSCSSISGFLTDVQEDTAIFGEEQVRDFLTGIYTKNTSRLSCPEVMVSRKQGYQCRLNVSHEQKGYQQRKAAIRHQHQTLLATISSLSTVEGSWRHARNSETLKCNPEKEKKSLPKRVVTKSRRSAESLLACCLPRLYIIINFVVRRSAVSARRSGAFRPGPATRAWPRIAARACRSQ